jgi:myosin heavy subunit
MRVTVIPPDKTITIDGRQIRFSPEDWDFDDDHIHAIQWFDNHGEIEWVTTDDNEELVTIGMVQPYIDLYLDEIPRIEKVRIEREENERKQLQSEVDERVNADREKQILLQRIRETADENRQLAKKAHEKDLEKERLKLQIEDKERELEIERELKAKELEKARIDAEIALAEEKSRAAIRAERARLEEEDNLMAAKKAELNEIFKTMSAELLSTKSDVDALVDEERELLENQRREYLKQQKLTQEALEKDQLEVEVKSKELKKTRDEMQNELQRQIELQLQERERIQADHTNLMAQFEVEKVNLQNELLEAKAQKELIEKELVLEQELLEQKDRAVEIERESLVVHQELLTKEKEEFNKLLEVERDNVNATLYEERARLEAERMLEQRIQTEVESAAREQATQKIVEIAENTDPLLIFDQIASNPDLDIQNFPVTEILGWFSQLQRVKEFCVKYNLTYQQVQNSPELKELCDEYVAQSRGHNDPGDD